MEDIPQPSDEAHSVGDRVQIYVGLDDQDSRFHGTVCEVLEVVTDDLDSETGRSTDAYSYTLRDVKTDEELPISFRHHDLVPVKNSQ
jgi:hypothetical protein